FQAEDGIRGFHVTGVQTCALPISPHGASAALIDRLLTKAEAAGTKPSVVDISADYRFPSNAAYAAVYKHDHGAPARLSQFTCASSEERRVGKESDAWWSAVQSEKR